MAKTSIEWADMVWNPTTGCTKVSAGCKNCYADVIAKRFWGERKFTDVRVHRERLDQPLHWRKPRRVFVNSMSDLFHDDVPVRFIGMVWSRMLECPQHQFMILTKRPTRMRDVVTRLVDEGKRKGLREASNIWLGVSAEDQATANQRIPLLLQTPAAVRFVSCEPLLGPVDLFDHLHHIDEWRGFDYNPGLGWVICGGESGPHARPMHPNWALSLRDQCSEAGVPFFFKQWGEWQLVESTQGWKLTGDSNFPAMHPSLGTAWASSDPFVKVGKKAAGRLLDGREWNEYPEA